MFNSFKKARNAQNKSKEIAKSLKEKNINIKCFSMFLDAKNLKINETNEDQPIDTGKTFYGVIDFNSTNGTGVTSTFT